jgi:hypothetical protein
MGVDARLEQRGDGGSIYMVKYANYNLTLRYLNYM